MSHTNPDPSGNHPMADPLAFVKSLWGNVNFPGMSQPVLSMENIDKQIADLKAVESWLTLNMNMLRSTIQTLEVQSATLSALQSMSAAMGAMATPQDAAVEAKSAPSNTANASDPISIANPAVWWGRLQDQFKHAVDSALAAEPEPESSPTAVSPSAKAKAKVKAKTATPRKRKAPSKS